MRFKIINESYDRIYLDKEDEIEIYRGIPIKGYYVQTKESRDDYWHNRIQWQPMDPLHTDEEHPDLWDDWSYDLDSVKSVIDDYFLKRLMDRRGD